MAVNAGNETFDGTHSAAPNALSPGRMAPVIGGVACILLWLLVIWSCTYLYWAMAGYPVAAMSWCPSGRWGSAYIQSLIERWQSGMFVGLVVGWQIIERLSTKCARIARFGVLINAAFWVAALIVLQRPWRWWI